jgi:hypothetical protein
MPVFWFRSCCGSGLSTGLPSSDGAIHWLLSITVLCRAALWCGLHLQVLPEVRQVRFTQPAAAAAAPKADAEAPDAAAAADAGADSGKAGARPGSSGGRKGSVASKSAKSKQKQRRTYYDTSSESDWTDSEVRGCLLHCGAGVCPYVGFRVMPACFAEAVALSVFGSVQADDGTMGPQASLQVLMYAARNVACTQLERDWYLSTDLCLHHVCAV